MVRIRDFGSREPLGRPRKGLPSAGSNAGSFLSKLIRQKLLPPTPRRNLLIPVALTMVLSASLWAAGGKEKLSYGEPLIVNIPVAEAEVEQVVEDVAGNGVIRGTKEYNKDEFVSGAKAAVSQTVFPEWTEGGKVFYKVRMQAIDPRNFKDSGDVGTLVVRYVLQPQG